MRSPTASTTTAGEPSENVISIRHDITCLLGSLHSQVGAGQRWGGKIVASAGWSIWITLGVTDCSDRGGLLFATCVDARTPRMIDPAMNIVLVPGRFTRILQQ